MNPDHQTAFDAFKTYIEGVYKRIENGEIPNQQEINDHAQKTLDVFKSIDQSDVHSVKDYMAQMIQEMDTLAAHIEARINTLKNQS